MIRFRRSLILGVLCAIAILLMTAPAALANEGNSPDNSERIAREHRRFIAFDSTCDSTIYRTGVVATDDLFYPNHRGARICPTSYWNPGFTSKSGNDRAVSDVDRRGHGADLG